MDASLLPGVFVRHPDAPHWGIGQIQSVIGTTVTVGFEHTGKTTLDLRRTRLERIDPPAGDRQGSPFLGSK